MTHASRLREFYEALRGRRAAGPRHVLLRAADELDRQRALIERCRTVFRNMAAERGGWFFGPRWAISHEPLRADAKSLLAEINAVLKDEKPDAVE